VRPGGRKSARRRFGESDQPLGQGGITIPDNHVYRIIQVAGFSENSIEDAIQNAASRASRTLRQVGWFEVPETRGHVEDGKVPHYQVTLKVGFTLDDDG
jgi:dodecin